MSLSKIETPERFWKNIQAGALAYQDIIKYGILLFGCTKHGKTTFSHLLANNILQPYKSANGQILYKLSNQKKQNDAVIGNQTNSETQIPNKFQTELKIDKQTIWIIDNPGFKDSYGIYRVLSNAYFHYRIFSKVQNIKFVLVLDSNMISAPYSDVHQLFREFLGSFSDLKTHQKKLIDAISIVVTKVKKEENSIQTMFEKLKAYCQNIKSAKSPSNLTKDQISFVEELILECSKDKKRLKIFNKAELNVIPERGNILKEINECTKFFERNVKQEISEIFTERIVDMTAIEFSQTKKVQKTLQVNKNQRQKMQNLFGKLDRTGESLMVSTINIVELMERLYLEEIDNLDTISKRKQALQKTNYNIQQILMNLREYYFEYDQSQKYLQKRKAVIQQIQKTIEKKKFVDKTFLERITLLVKIYNIFSSWDTNQIAKFNIGLYEMKTQFQIILLSVSHLLNKQSRQLFTQYTYHIERYFQQSILFEMIIRDKQNNKILTEDQLYRGLKQNIYKIYDLFVNALDKKRYLQKSQLQPLSEKLLNYHLKINPKAIRNEQCQEDLLFLLRKYTLTKENQIECMFLKLKFLQKKYYILGQVDDPNIFPESKEIELIRFINSTLKFLIELKSIYQLTQFKEFVQYQQQILLINHLGWKYLTSAFCCLVKEISSYKEISQDTKLRISEYFSIIDESLGSGNNSSDMLDFFEDFIAKLQNEIKSIKLTDTVILMKDKEKDSTEKKSVSDTIIGSSVVVNSVKYYENKVPIMLQKKKTKSLQIIKYKLKYAKILNQFGLKQHALTVCYQAKKYIQFCPEQLEKINNLITEVKQVKIFAKMQNGDILKGSSHLKIFEASQNLKKLLAKFLKENDFVNPYKIFE